LFTYNRVREGKPEKIGKRRVKPGINFCRKKERRALLGGVSENNAKEGSSKRETTHLTFLEYGRWQVEEVQKLYLGREWPDLKGTEEGEARKDASRLRKVSHRANADGMTG